MQPPTGTSARIGDPLSRIDGRAKVTGQARYAAEYPVDGLLHGWVVSGAIAKGRITTIRDKGAWAVPGVVEVITHKNRPHIPWFDQTDAVSDLGSPFRALYDDRILFSGQPIALVVAETLETACYAASLVEADYETGEHNTRLEAALPERFVPKGKASSLPKSRGDAAAAFAAAPLKIAAEYHLPPHYHNPMELHATTAVWEGDGRITLHEKTQGPQRTHKKVSAAFGLPAGKLRVLNPYVGGAFGSGLQPQYQTFLAVLAARMLQRSVRVVLTRQQMFTHVHRPEAIQSVSLATDGDGRLVAIRNDATTATSRFETHMETVCDWGLINYACENASADYAIAPLDISTPGDMRAPGAATGMTLFELAIDEMASAAGIDPLQFRLINYSEKDAMNDRPFTSKALREAYAQGAARFGWDRRSPEPRSMKEGHELVGWGAATGIWEAMFQKCSARARLSANGDLEVATAASDIGTGTYTILAQIAAETLGIPVEQITVRIGDSDLPSAPVEGGSFMAASAGAAVQAACRSVAKKLIEAARKLDCQPLTEAGPGDIALAQGRVVVKTHPDYAISFGAIMNSAGLSAIEAEETVKQPFGDLASQERKSRNTHSAIFAEARVDEELGVVRIPRIVIAVAGGRIINPKTARSQILGGVVMGIGMALHEEAFTDHRIGRRMNHNYAEYHVPVNADIENIDVIFVDEHDPEVTPLGVKGVGEIGIVGTAAAVINAIYHATGKRVRNLPVTIDKLLD